MHLHTATKKKKQQQNENIMEPLVGLWTGLHVSSTFYFIFLFVV